MYKEEFIRGNISKNKTIVPIGIVVHHTNDYSEKSVINSFTNPDSMRSAHVLIKKNGDRIVFAKDTERAWHSGRNVS